MDAIDKILQIIRAKWQPTGKERVATIDEILADCYDPETNSLKGK